MSWMLLSWDADDEDIFYEIVRQASTFIETRLKFMVKFNITLTKRLSPD